jgi:pimeloyl-ACP methyl ester carboxylesterase
MPYAERDGLRLYYRALVADDPGPVQPTDVATALYAGFAEELAGPTGEDVRRAWVHFGMTFGAGHFHQLEVPEQVNAMIGRFLA